MHDTQTLIREVCTEIADMLVEKNKAYGDSAVHPMRIFSKASNVEQILVRIDDKLNRIRNNPGAFGEDAVLDLIGYLILYRVAERINAPSPKFKIGSRVRVLGFMTADSATIYAVRDGRYLLKYDDTTDLWCSGADLVLVENTDAD